MRLNDPEGVAHGQRVDLEDRPHRQLQRHHEPVVAVDQTELGEQHPAEVPGAGGEPAEIHHCVLELLEDELGQRGLVLVNGAFEAFSDRHYQDGGKDMQGFLVRSVVHRSRQEPSGGLTRR